MLQIASNENGVFAVQFNVWSNELFKWVQHLLGQIELATVKEH
jgi:hypothetical protein